MNIWLAIWAILDFASVSDEPPNAEIPAVVCEYFVDDCPRALGIAWCESLHNPRAYHPEGSHGLFQIHEPTWGKVFKEHWHKRYEVEQSTRFAAHIIEHTKAKWNLWTCGRYKP